jgi:uncharacterized protein (DUF3084 family)
MIQVMMHLEKEKRPSVEDLMQHPKLSQYIKEYSMRDMIMNTKKKEEDIIKKEKLVKEKEADIEKRLKEIEEKEKQLKELEERLLAR